METIKVPMTLDNIFVGAKIYDADMHYLGKINRFDYNKKYGAYIDKTGEVISGVKFQAYIDAKCQIEFNVKTPVTKDNIRVGAKYFVTENYGRNYSRGDIVEIENVSGEFYKLTDKQEFPLEDRCAHFINHLALIIEEKEKPDALTPENTKLGDVAYLKEEYYFRKGTKVRAIACRGNDSHSWCWEADNRDSEFIPWKYLTRTPPSVESIDEIKKTVEEIKTEEPLEIYTYSAVIEFENGDQIKIPDPNTDWVFEEKIIIDKFYPLYIIPSDSPFTLTYYYNDGPWIDITIKHFEGQLILKEFVHKIKNEHCIFKSLKKFRKIKKQEEIKEKEFYQKKFVWL